MLNNKKTRDIGELMKLATPFNNLTNSTTDMWRMHDFNYKSPKEAKQDLLEQVMYRLSNN